MDIPSVEELLKGENTVFLATADKTHPRVRPVTMVENGELIIQGYWIKDYPTFIIFEE